MRPTAALRLAVNAVNLSTLLGLAVAYVGRARVTVAHEGLFVARGFTLGVRTAPAFTVGNVIILRLDDEALARRPRLLVHEARHATQYAWCIGPVFLPLYLAAAGWSWLRARDFASYNVFERLAGLEDGGYPPPPRRRSRPSRR